jgi:hypothetical protein
MVVNGSVEFHNQPCFRAIEIGDEWSQDVLPAELESGHLLSADRGPEQSFGARRFPTHLPRRRFQDIPCSGRRIPRMLGHKPHPDPPRWRGGRLAITEIQKFHISILKNPFPPPRQRGGPGWGPASTPPPRQRGGAGGGVTSTSPPQSPPQRSARRRCRWGPGRRPGPFRVCRRLCLRLWGRFPSEYCRRARRVRPVRARG